MTSFTYVYILQTVSEPCRFYVGSTTDLKQRLKDHNQGKSSHTAKYRPWIIRTAIAFSHPQKAFAFERYLKTASGRAFSKKRF